MNIPTNLNPQTIAVDLQAIINITNAILPIVAAFSPGVAQNATQIKLGTTAAQALIPIIQSIPTNTGVITPEQQAALLSRVYSILAGDEMKKPEWQIQS